MNVLIVEDEKKTAELLKELIEERSDYLVVQTCPSIERTVTYLKKHQNKLDLIFMDIQLADGESFEIFEETEIRIPVIFCTAYDQHVLKAFKRNGIDYILKPFKEEDIHKALEKVEAMKSSLSKGMEPDAQTIKNLFADELAYQKTFLVRHQENLVPVQVSDIAFVHLTNEMVNIYNFKGQKNVIFKNLEEIESSVDPAQFFRINRQMIVNRDAIKEISPYFKRKVIVKLPFDIPEKAVVSRMKVTPFLDWMEKPE
ncbi:LytR/AlgR family response regulator transcription factor [Halalkalibaculum sp. DA3122]|uniref:LytR/AlgR family response regulator transcription factor n=1 Tax=Halalkalibaculum sp. DA3122 TaxID=3373607 RepID=UPI0037545140